MSDFRLVSYTTGLVLLALGALMIFPAVIDLAQSGTDWRAFLAAAILTTLFGGALTLASYSGRVKSVSIQQAFLIIVTSWVLLPFFGALPFVFGRYEMSLIDALFEAVSGMTTTGSTVFISLQYAPDSLLLWRALLQWIGGLGIVLFALAFLPTLRIGGMQLFRSEGLENDGSLLVRLRDIAPTILKVYVGLSLACALLYLALGMALIDAVCHAMTTISTGGFGTRDSSFADYNTLIQLTCVAFMLIGSLPFLRYVELFYLKLFRFHRDSQVRTFFFVVLAIWALTTIARLAAAPAADGDAAEAATVSVLGAAMDALFNCVSIITGTGFVSANYGAWGDVFIIGFFLMMFIGGCAGSTTCSVKIFRYQVLATLAYAELQRMRRPNRVVILRFGGQPLPADVAASVTTYIFLFVLSLVVFTILLSATGENLITSVSGAATALANVGPGLGAKIGPVGTFSNVNDAGKAVLIAAMLVGRLEMMSVFILATPGFWRR